MIPPGLAGRPLQNEISNNVQAAKSNEDRKSDPSGAVVLKNG
jgi:hypothetical protein